jgi:hypothetical protein
MAKHHRVSRQAAKARNQRAERETIMRRLLFVLGAVMAIAALTAPAALATNPHFITASDDVTNSGDLTANFKIAGLGDNVTITVTLSADATAQYACINGGKKHPQASNKETVTSPISASGSFTSDKNGSVTGSLTAHPPSAGDFSCPPGQQLVFTYVQYTNVTLTGGGATETLADQTFGTLI